MGNFNRSDRPSGGFRGGGGRPSFGGNRSRFAHRDSGSDNFDRGAGRGQRPMFQTVCSNCGKECEVPFKPTNGKPVYCSDCFEKMGNRADKPRFDDRRPQGTSNAPELNRSQLDALHAKLDKILILLQPKVETKSDVIASGPVSDKKLSVLSENVDETDKTKKVKSTKTKKVEKKKAPAKKK
jgi:CxxC-x17-CxxC domain-containing protein